MTHFVVDWELLNEIDFAQQFDGLIFDCDGTLSHSMPLHYIAWRDTLNRYGIEFGEDRFYSMGGMPSEKIIATLSGEQSVSVDADRTAVEKEEAFAGMLDQLEPLLPICNIARSHRERMAMAVASGGIRPIVARQLNLIGVADLFSVLVTAEDTELHKPEPDVFLEAARQIGIAPNRCLVFEDSELGFEAASRAGMHYVDVRPIHPL